MERQNKKSKDYKINEEKKLETNSLNNNMLLTTQKWKFGKAKFP
ncbi:MAG: hypothetical protein QXG67_04425 [Candidatus Nitrosotenuis sp.]